MTHESSVKLFQQICERVHKGHAKPSRSNPLATVNAIYTKHRERHVKPRHPELDAAMPSELSATNVRVHMQWLTTEELAEIAPPPGNRHSSNKPAHRSDPVLLVKFRDYVGLLDGGTRIQTWLRDSQQGKDDPDHLAFIFEIVE